MDLERIREEVCDGVYSFDRPLTITSVAWQDNKLVCYPSCTKCMKTVKVCPNGGYVCETQKWQGFPPTNRFATHMLLVDWNGDQLWATAFADIMKVLLVFDVNTCMALVTEDDRCEAMSLLHNTPMRVTVQRRTKGGYINYTVKTVEVVGV